MNDLFVHIHYVNLPLPIPDTNLLVYSVEFTYADVRQIVHNTLAEHNIDHLVNDPLPTQYDVYEGLDYVLVYLVPLPRAGPTTRWTELYRLTYLLRNRADDHHVHIYVTRCRRSGRD